MTTDKYLRIGRVGVGREDNAVMEVSERQSFS